MEKMKELYAKVAGDPALQAKFAAIIKEAAEAGEATKEKLAVFAKDTGYEVTPEESREYFKSLADQAAQKDGVLSDAELDAVAGGKQVGQKEFDIMSYLTLGFGCVLASLVDAYDDRVCRD